MILNLLVVSIFILNVCNALIIYVPKPGNYPNKTTKPNFYLKSAVETKLDCEVTKTKRFIIHPEKYDCNQEQTWHYEYIKTAYENSTTNKCEEINVVSLVSEKYIMPVSDRLLDPIKIQATKQKSSCGKGYFDGFNFFSYKLNDIKDVWSVKKSASNLLVTKKYPDNVKGNQRVAYDQLLMHSVHLAALSEPMNPALVKENAKVGKGKLENIDDSIKTIQLGLSSAGNKFFEKACTTHNDLISSKKEITGIMNNLLDRQDLEIKRIGSGVVVRQCKVLDPKSVIISPLFN